MQDAAIVFKDHVREAGKAEGRCKVVESVSEKPVVKGGVSRHTASERGGGHC